MLVPSLEHRGLRGFDWDVVPRIEPTPLSNRVNYLLTVEMGLSWRSIEP